MNITYYPEFDISYSSVIYNHDILLPLSRIGVYTFLYIITYPFRVSDNGAKVAELGVQRVMP